MSQPSAAAIGVEATGITKIFGSFKALDNVSIKVTPGSLHALLGENGAGKSTLVKCIMGYYRADAGAVIVDGQERQMANPRDAMSLGVGMVYQHFTLVPAMTVAENLVMSRREVPAVIDWAGEIRGLESFMAGMPFKVPLRATVADLSAGERQKTEILKQLYLRSRFLILDEPTSVLTPDEADEMLGLLKGMTQRGELTVLMISHKFREVTAYADEVTVLRKGRLAGSGAVKDLTRGDMAAMMIGTAELPAPAARQGKALQEPVLVMKEVTADDPSGREGIDIRRMVVQAGEIVGIAGVSGNGQKQLVEVLGGQRRPTGGDVIVLGEDYRGARDQSQALKVRCLPEEPLRNACVGRMAVAENLAFRSFDADGAGTRFWLSGREMAEQARSLIRRYGIKTASKDSPIQTLSGGNVQRTVLARELNGEVKLLVVANPCFGLDFAATALIRGQIVEARNHGTAVLLISEDLDEVLELSDRVLVMSEGRIVYETPIEAADRHTIGHHMAGHH